MKNKNSWIFFSILSIFLCGPVFMIYGVGIYDETEIKTDKKELGELYKELKKEKEPPKEEYLEHLLTELKKDLKKGKKEGKIRRVEGKLVEIDKGAVHKVHERDVYIVYDSLTGKYKGKIEIEAIADAISIGESYEQKRVIYPGDTIKFRGQRRYMEIGLTFGDNEFRGEGERYSGLGTFWKYNFRGGYGAEFLLSFIEKLDENIVSKGNNRYIVHSDVYDIYFCLGAKKYFLFPSIVSPFIGSGISLLGLEYNRSERLYGLQDISTNANKFKKYIFLPYFSAGIQLFSGQPLHVDLEARYFHGPKLNVEPEPVTIRPILYLGSVSFTW